MRTWFGNGRWRYVLTGGAIYWAPDVVYRGIIRAEPSLTGVIALNVLLPIWFVFAYSILQRSRYAPRNGQSLAIAMLVGFWVLDGTFVTLSFTLTGGGVHTAGWGGSAIGALLLTIVPFYASLYDFTPVAFLVSTVLMILMHRHERAAQLKASGDSLDADPINLVGEKSPFRSLTKL